MWVVKWFKKGQWTEARPYCRELDKQIGEVCTRAQVQWVPDICRHMCISNLVELRRNDAHVARECGTSEGVIYSRYHNMRDPEEVSAWAGLRP